MSAPTVFLSAASDDLESLRNVLHGAFSRAGFRVFTQKHSLGAAPGTLREYLVEHIDKSHCVIHLAGIAYGSDADEPFADAPLFQCSWTQFEYYYAHQQDKSVIAFVCAPDLFPKDFTEKGVDVADIARRQGLQKRHRECVASGRFTGTPLDGKVKRTLNEPLDSMEALVQAIAATVAKVQGLAGARTAEISLQPGLHTLPPRPDGFVGRDADLATLRAVNPAAGAVLTGLKGMGGIGKTALAVVLAYEWLPRFPDAQVFLDARGTHAHSPSAADLLAQVIQAFNPTGMLPDDLDALKHSYHGVLHDKKVLILLDNARDAAQAAPLIPPEGCALIVTSRQNFMLGKSAAHKVGRLPDDQAVTLLREHYPALGDADAAALVGVCAGLPLALRLAGAHLALDASERGGHPDVSSYLKALRGGRLDALNHDALDAGEITVSETLRLSEDQLTSAEREVWRRLGIFTASFDERAAQVIAGANESMLAHFLRRSMLEREGAERYKLHDLAADYAHAQHTESGLNDLHLVHARHYVEIAWKTDVLYKRKGQTEEGLALFDRERTQFEAAFNWLALQQHEAAARLLLSLVANVALTGDLRFEPRQRIVWSQAQFAAARLTGNRNAEGWALGNLGIAHRQLGDSTKAIGYHEQQLAIACAINDRQGEGAALGNLGVTHTAFGDARKAIAFYERQLVIVRQIDDQRGEGAALGNLGIACFELGDVRKAIELYEQQLAIVREIGDQQGEGIALGNLGNAYAGLKKTHKAIEFYEQQLVVARLIGDRHGEDNALGSLGLAYRRTGNVRKAIEFHEQKLAITRKISHRRGEGAALGDLGVAHFALGDVCKALEFCEQSAIIARQIGDRRGEANALFYSALAFHLRGDVVRAIASAEPALELYEATEAPATAMVRRTLARWRAEM